MQLLHTAKDLSATVLEDDCLIMEVQLAAIHIQFSLMSTLIYVETISIFQVGKFYSTWHHLFLYILRFSLAFFFLNNGNSSAFPLERLNKISPSKHKVENHQH